MVVFVFNYYIRMLLKMMKQTRIIFFVLCIFTFGACTSDDDGSSSSNTNQTVQQPSESNSPSVPPPDPTTLSAPANNEICLEGQEIDTTRSSVTFSWNVSSNTDSYDLVITNQKTNSTQTEGGITSTSRSVILENDQSYSWKVISKANNTSDSGTSAVWQFYLAGDGQENHTPFAATILSPAAGAAVDATAGNVDLSWEGNDPDLDDTLSYTIYFGENNPPIEIISEEIQDTSVSVTVESGTTYYWRIKTSDGVNSSYTLVYSFLVN